MADSELEETFDDGQAKLIRDHASRKEPIGRQRSTPGEQTRCDTGTHYVWLRDMGYSQAGSPVV